MSSDEDRARLLAALTLAFRSGAATDADTNESFEERLARVGAAMRGRHWQITVARDLRLGPLVWLSHPWHCLKLRALVRQLLSGAIAPHDEQRSLKLLTRCAAMIEFGVDVNATWYRRLREAVASGRATAPELRALLRGAPVWWGTSLAKGTSKWAAIPVLSWLWTMGRPEAGELLLSEHHWVTKSLLTALLMFSGAAFAIVLIALGRHVAAGNADSKTAGLIVATYSYGLLFWASWWLGPHSWSSLRRLRAILQLPNPCRSA